MTFIDIDQLKIEAYVTQDIAYRVQPRQNVLLTLDVQPDTELEAQIAEVSKGTTQNNLSYLVTALLPNKEARLLAGMSGKIRFEESASELSDSTATGEHLVCIPQTALCNRPTVGSYVWTVHPESGIVSQRKVSVSKLLPHGNAGITAGLQPGEIVATSSLRFLSDGMKVKSNETASIMKLIKYFLQRRSVTILLLVLVLAGGLFSYVKMGKLEDAPFTIKQALVLTSYPGASPSEVQSQVTDVLEEAIQSLGELYYLKPRTVPGFPKSPYM